jgi:hypothetical protein
MQGGKNRKGNLLNCTRPLSAQVSIENNNPEFDRASAKAISAPHTKQLPNAAICRHLRARLRPMKKGVMLIANCQEKLGDLYWQLEMIIADFAHE